MKPSGLYFNIKIICYEIESFVYIYSKERNKTIQDFYAKNTAHSGGKHLLHTPITATMTQHSSFPWQPFWDHVSSLDTAANRRGRAFLYFPHGELSHTYDNTFGDDFNYYIDDVPGMLDFTTRAFTFRKGIR